MTAARFALLVALVGSSCVTNDVDPIAGPAPSAEESADVTQAYAPPPNSDDAFCDELPADGPCALACDVDALAEEYVPAGTCAAFSCTLDDGREIGVHVCHPPD